MGFYKQLKAMVLTVFWYEQNSVLNLSKTIKRSIL